MTFAMLYGYGHLLAVAFSLSVALAYAVVALRVPGARKDLWLAVTYSLTAATAAVEMWLALQPSLLVGRLYLMLGGAIFLSFIVTFHLQHAREVLPDARRRMYWKGISLTLAYAAVLLVLLLAGVLDGGRHHAVTDWGARSMLPAMPAWAVALCGVYSLANIVLCAELFHRDGPHRTARWLVSLGMWAGPLVAGWDLAICAGINPHLPIGGYFATLLGLDGAVLLIERLRPMSQPDSSIAGYTLEKRLGSGGMAEVFLAHRRPMSGIDSVVQRVALKRLRTDHVDDPHFVRMFLDEARLVARLSHPNIVQLLDAGRDRGELYLALELVEGATLQQIFRAANTRGERVSPAVVAEVGVQLCAALEYAHDLAAEDGRPLELVHRDISPQNVLVDRYGNVKLADFGIARSTDRLTETATGFIKGKLTYMAPEQLQGRPFDRRADLYALGVILFELLTGERLHQSISDTALIYEILAGRNARLALLSERNPGFGQVVRTVLAVDPEQRPANAAWLRAQLSSLREDTRGRDELARWVEVAVNHLRQPDEDPPRRHDPAVTTATHQSTPSRRRV